MTTTSAVDHTANNNTGTLNNLTYSFDNVTTIPGFNSIGWYESIAWTKDGTELSTANVLTAELTPGSYQLVVARDHIIATDQWNVTQGLSETIEDLVADETLCADDPLEKKLADIKISVLESMLECNV